MHTSELEMRNETCDTTNGVFLVLVADNNLRSHVRKEILTADLTHDRRLAHKDGQK